MKRSVYKIASFGAAALAALIIIFTTTNPITIPSLLLLVVFVALYVLLAASLLLGLVGLSRASIIGGQYFVLRRIAFASAGFLVFVVVLRSIGQLTVRDLTIGTVFAILLYVYYVRLQQRPTQDKE